MHSLQEFKAKISPSEAAPNVYSIITPVWGMESFREGWSYLGSRRTIKFDVILEIISLKFNFNVISMVRVSEAGAFMLKYKQERFDLGFEQIRFARGKMALLFIVLARVSRSIA